MTNICCKVQVQSTQGLSVDKRWFTQSWKCHTVPHGIKRRDYVSGHNVLRCFSYSKTAELNDFSHAKFNLQKNQFGTDIISRSEQNVNKQPRVF